MAIKEGSDKLIVFKYDFKCDVKTEMDGMVNVILIMLFYFQIIMEVLNIYNQSF